MAKSSPRGIYVIALTRTGAKTAELAAKGLGGVALVPEKFAADVDAEPFEEPVAEIIKKLWPLAGGFILIMAAGIAVRSIAPLIKDKYSDPAVVVMDPEGFYAVPLLSGHVGGANDLARELHDAVGAIPVITTATDALNKPAIESWALSLGYKFEPREGVVKVNSAWANGDGVVGYLDPALPKELFGDLRRHLSYTTSDLRQALSSGEVVVALSHREVEQEVDLLIRPPLVAIGVGCRKDADPARVEEGVLSALREGGISRLAVGVVASVDAKRDEEAIIKLAEKLGVEYATFTAEELGGYKTPNPSPRVEEAVGTPSVCEAAALAAAAGGDLILEKRSGGVWTLAAALIDISES
ncbi:MAG: hypothetical protein C0609_08745 [Deltaproteobacteria bacterium]|nr:MAG: hypothetical protein C0609_08745 [Deltaproteobacteria bacterium]